MIRLFLRFQFQKSVKYFKTKRLAKVITSLLFLTILVFVGIGLYEFFVSGLRFINNSIEEELRLPLLLFIYELFILILAGVIVLSSLVSGVFSLFETKGNEWLMSTPMYKVFPRLIFIKSLITSSWPLFVIFLPVILAFNHIYNLGFVSFAFIVLSVLFLVLLLNALTLFAVITLGTIFYYIAEKFEEVRFSFKRFVTLIILVLVVIAGVIWRVIANLDLVKLFKADDADTNVTISYIGSFFDFLPTHPIALTIMSLQLGQIGSALFYIALIALLAVLSGSAYFLFSVFFYPMWQKFQEGDARNRNEQSLRKSHAYVYHFNGSSTLALIKKEMMVSSRNVKGLLWFLFLLSIWLVQIGSNIILAKNVGRHNPDISETFAILQSLQFIISIYFISAFTLRFAFPSFSTERKTAWIVASAPLSFIKIFLSKYLFFTGFFSVVAISMTYLSTFVLHIPFSNAVYALLLLVAVVVCIVTFGLTLGALFPSTDTDDPEVMSTSMPGLFFTVLSLLYGALAAWVLYLSLTQHLFIYLYMLLAVTIISTCVLLLTTLNIGKRRVLY
jgi:hypothetical protein